MPSPDDSPPFRVNSLAEEEVDRMAHVVAERANEDYLATLLQANPQLLAENEAVYGSLKDKQKAEGIRQMMVRLRAEQQKFFDELDKKEAPPEESDDPIPPSSPTTSVEDAGSSTGGEMPTWSDSTITGFIDYQSE
jgi:hypothetical protein